MKKKLLLSALLTLSAVVLVVATVLTTIAFLAHQASVTNTFTMGNVLIHLYESKVNENGEKITNDDGSFKDENGDQMKDSIGNSYKISPNGSYDKDPTVYVMPESDECILFVQVQNGIREVEAPAVEGVYTQMADQMKANGWHRVGRNALGNVYVYAGKDVDVQYPADKHGVVVADTNSMQKFDLFTNFKIKDNATREGVEGKTLIVNAYAIQEESFATTTTEGVKYLTKENVHSAWNALVGNFDTALELIPEEQN